MSFFSGCDEYGGVINLKGAKYKFASCLEIRQSFIATGLFSKHDVDRFNKNGQR